MNKRGAPLLVKYIRIKRFRSEKKQKHKTKEEGKGILLQGF
jgi:hypothetical protein